MNPVEPFDAPAQYLTSALAERGVGVSDITRAGDAYIVRAHGAEYRIPAPEVRARVVLWAMIAADEIARSAL